MARVEWREGDEIHYKEYTELGSETKNEKAKRIMEESGVSLHTQESVVKSLELFNGTLVKITQTDSTGRTKILWEDK